MRILLDTNAFLRMAADPDNLATDAARLIEDEAVELLLSAASAWEFAIKSALGKLALPEPVNRYVPSRMHSMGVDPLPIEHVHALHVATLPRHHRDPFDRLLIAQAQIERVPVMTSDAAFQRYDVEVIPV